MHPNSPFDGIFRALVRGRSNLLVWWTAGLPKPSHDKNAYMTLKQWQAVLSRNMRTGMQSLHLKPRWDEFLVFDVDVRETTSTKTPEEIRDALGCTHAASAPICAKCWPIAQAACFLADEWITKRFDLSKPLIVFSGSGGIHLWYRFGQDVDASIAFASQHDRDSLLKLWNTSPLPTELADAIPLYARADAVKWRPQFDAGVTAQPHAIRMPFSLNEKTSRYALPLPHSRLPEWPDKDDINTGSQCFVEWAEFD